MFSDDVSETWDSSEFQDSFIKNYFRKQKVSKQKTSLNYNNDVEINPSAGNLKDASCDAQKKRVSCEILVESKNDSELIVSSTVKRNRKKKRRLSNEIQLDNCLVKHENDSDLSKVELDFQTTDSSSLKSKKKRKRKTKSKNFNEEQTSSDISEQISFKQLYNEDEIEAVENDMISNTLPNKNLFQSKLGQKLQAAKFRYLNEMLYTNTGKDALKYFKENTDEFQDYHEGYQSQVSKWPINPVDIVIKELRQVNKQDVIADLGCGEAKIAEAFPNRTVHSFDLIALKDCVTACDMSNVPLPSGSVDIVVFCLSLMGTNWKDYLKEGHRLLKLGALLKIAEIESRIDNLNNFIKNIEAHGFSLVNKDVSHKMFFFLNFKKVRNKVKSSKIPPVILKPCLYKKR